jgi:hypothetical protein
MEKTEKAGGIVSGFLLPLPYGGTYSQQPPPSQHAEPLQQSASIVLWSANELENIASTTADTTMKRFIITSRNYKDKNDIS